MNGDDVGDVDLERALSDLGPFAAAQLHEPSTTPAPGWEPMASLRDPGRLTARIGAVREALCLQALHPVGARVAASVTQLGLAARVLAPVIALRALGLSTNPRLDDVWWQDLLGGPVPLSLPRPVQRPAPQPTSGTRHTLDLPTRGPVPPAVEELTTLVLDTTGLSPRIAWGNLASGTNSAAGIIGATRPDLHAATAAAADALLADPRLDGGALRVGPGFRRRSCCQIYRIAGDRAAACGDCVLTP